jgi:hypothetical protein
MESSSLHCLPAMASGGGRERERNVLCNDTVEFLRLYNVCDKLVNMSMERLWNDTDTRHTKW